MTRKYFGTDGVRGTVGQFPITPDFVLKLGWAAGSVLAERGQSKILIGKDTRISGYMFESALEAGISAAGVDVLLLGPMPTPAIAYLTTTFHAQAGIVISASHNPYTDNGIKFFGADGRKLPDSVERDIEARLDEKMEMASADSLGKVRRIVDARGRYIEFCKSTVLGRLSLKGMKIVVDCANGAAYHIAPDVLEELGAEVIELATQPDGLNINLDCGSTHPERLQKTVVETGADLGIALDGDADRVLMVDDQGNLVDGDQLLYILALDRKLRGGLEGGAVGTLMSNFGLELALQREGIPFGRANVGDRYVIEMLDKNGWQLGGEASGHIVCLDCTSTGDGVVSALQVLAALQLRNCSLRDACAGMQKLPQTMINVRGARRDGVTERDDVKQAISAAEARLAGKGRVLLRPSGTEPLIRVMVEGEDESLVAQVCGELADTVQSAIA
ncbi:phosphoglucosamine mutase [Isoalcanivorax pacificus W11-5]|uniref:Phosphoglucosamine mutase n=1 Tax=Isoalcanivorax pacificus W11-5 TaxID=391936 RepID=A0A0B4XSJ0_9GAMM|nr:phosphoglucosamine mutase [Isoalcanivorax pacificus]AJD49715.1 phosphoglucosamine mutase [Isoalcanivorax pacificus W11-5]